MSNKMSRMWLTNRSFRRSFSTTFRHFQAEEATGIRTGKQEYFFDPQIQNLLKRLTGLDYTKVSPTIIDKFAKLRLKIRRSFECLKLVNKSQPQPMPF